MKVLVITMWKPRKGGIVTHVENLIRRSKNDFTVLTYRDGAGKDESNVLRVPYINLPFLRGVSFAIFSFFKAVRADFDIIHAHYAIPQGFAGALIKKVKKRPLILTIHGSDLTVLGASPLVRPVLKWILDSSDRIIAVSNYMKGLINDLGVSEGKVRVIYNGVNRQALAKGNNRRVIFIGALVKQKGADVLIQAFTDVEKKHEDVKLFIVGDGPERKRLEGLAKELGLADVEFKGYVDDIDRVFTSRSVLVIPSREEGFGIVALEAMVRGVPVVASSTGGIPEIVKDGKNGLLFTKGSHKALAEAVKNVFDDKNLRERMIKNGLKTVESFSWERTAEEIEDVYREVSG